MRFTVKFGALTALTFMLLLGTYLPAVPNVPVLDKLPAPPVAEAAPTTIDFRPMANQQLDGIETSVTTAIDWGQSGADVWRIEGGMSETLIHFNDATPNGNWTGQYPTGYSWEANRWYLSPAGTGSEFPTKSFSFRNSNPQTGTLTFPTASTIVSIDVYNYDASATSDVTITCGTDSHTWEIESQEIQRIQTGWTGTCTTVSFTSSNGWDTNFDNIVVGTPSATSHFLAGSPTFPAVVAAATFADPGSELISMSVRNPNPTFPLSVSVMCGINQTVESIAAFSVETITMPWDDAPCANFMVSAVEQIEIQTLTYDVTAPPAANNDRYMVEFTNTWPADPQAPGSDGLLPVTGHYPTDVNLLDFGNDLGQPATESPPGQFHSVVSALSSSARSLMLNDNDGTFDITASDAVLRAVSVHNRHQFNTYTATLTCTGSATQHVFDVQPGEVRGVQLSFGGAASCDSIRIQTSSNGAQYLEWISLEFEVDTPQPPDAFGNPNIELDPFDLSGMLAITGPPSHQKIAFPYEAHWFGPYNRINIYADTTGSINTTSGTVKVALYSADASTGEPDELLRKCEVTVADNAAAWYSCSVTDQLLFPGDVYHLVVWHASASGFNPVFRHEPTGLFAWAGGSGDFPAQGGTWTTTFGPIMTVNNASFYMDRGSTNNPPSFGIISSSNAPYNGGPQSHPNFAFDINSNDPGQGLTGFNLTLLDATGGLTFSSAPAISTAGTLTYTSTTNTSGTAWYDVTLTDAGGAVSAAQMISITVSGPSNTAPTISNISDQTTNEDTAESNVAFTVGDAQTAVGSLTVSGTSSNTTLVPNANITFGGSGANRTVTVTPAANQNGTATITVRVTDGGGLFAEDTFVQTVTSVNDNPTVSNIANQSTTTGTPVSNIAFTVGDVETAAGSLVVTGASSNTTLLPNANITFGGSGANRTVTVSPAAGQTGTATVTVTATDANSGSGNDTFTLTVGSCVGTPSFSIISGQNSLEDAGPISSPGYASSISPANGTFTLTQTSVSGGLTFSTAPALSPTGTLTYTATANSNGSAQYDARYVCGANQSAPQAFIISVTPVNDEPSFTKGADRTHPNGTSGAQSVTGWATNISVGPSNESAQSVSFTSVSHTNPALFTVLPSVAANGTLSYTLASGQSGTSTTTIRMQDNGGTDFGGDDTTPNQTFNITVDPPQNPCPYNNVTVNLPSTVGFNTTPVAYSMSTAMYNSWQRSGTSVVPAWGISGNDSPAKSLTQAATLQVKQADGTWDDYIFLSDLPSTYEESNAAPWPDIALPQSSEVRIHVRTTGAQTITNFKFCWAFAEGSGSNTPPTISNIANQTTNEDTPLNNVAFTVGDAETAAGSLTVSGTSSNTTLLPNANITFGGSGANRTVSMNPAANQSGTTTVTVTVQDAGGLTASDQFTLTVNAVNDAPTISAIADQTTNPGVSTGPIAFTINDIETAVGDLIVMADSDDPISVPESAITLGGSGANRTISIQPVVGVIGDVLITVTVLDELDQGDSEEFILHVVAPSGGMGPWNGAVTSDSNVSTLPFTQPGTAAANRVLYAQISSWRNGGGQNPTSVTCAGQALTLMGSFDGGNDNDNKLSVWRLVNPPSGGCTSGNSAITFSQAHDVTAAIGIIAGVNQSDPDDPIVITDSTATNPSANVATETGDRVMNFTSFWGAGSSATAVSPLVRRIDGLFGSQSKNSISVGDATGSGTITVGWTISGAADRHGMISFNINKAP